MRILKSPWLIAPVVTLAVVAAAIFFTRAYWMEWLTAHAPESLDDRAPQAPGGPKMLKLGAAARKNLGLVTQQVALQPYWRSIQVPGVIVDRPGVSDRGVTASATGVVAKIYAFPGDTVRPGEPLFSLRLLSESLHLAQTELFKSAQETQLTLGQKKLLIDSGVDKINPGRVVELDLQLRRLAVAAQAYRQDLLSRGLSDKGLKKVVEGEFVTEMDVLAPEPLPGERGLVTFKPAGGLAEPSNLVAPVFEVHELKVDLGQQVQAGQTLCLLANHQSLLIEGHSFKREAPFLEKAAQNGWPVRVDFAEDDDTSWPPLKQTFAIRHLSNTVDEASRTFGFFLPLANQSRSYEKDGKTFLVWRFRPGQRVRLHVPVEEFKEVIVLPPAAVAREGPEAYVFRQSGDLFERRAVHVVHEDRLNVVLANDGAVRLELDYVAQGAAASLNRILKAQNTGGGLPPGAHFHADGSLHIPGK